MVHRDQLTETADTLGLYDFATVARMLGLNPVALRLWAAEREPDHARALAEGVLIGALVIRGGHDEGPPEMAGVVESLSYAVA